MSERESVKKSRVALNASVAIALSTNCDLAIECFGFGAIESLDVRVVRPVGFPILTLPFHVYPQCFIEWSLPYSPVLRNTRILSSSFLSKTCEEFALWALICLCSHRFSLAIIIIASLVVFGLLTGSRVRLLRRTSGLPLFHFDFDGPTRFPQTLLHCTLELGVDAIQGSARAQHGRDEIQLHTLCEASSCRRSSHPYGSLDLSCLPAIAGRRLPR